MEVKLNISSNRYFLANCCLIIDKLYIYCHSINDYSMNVIRYIKLFA